MQPLADVLGFTTAAAWASVVVAGIALVLAYRAGSYARKAYEREKARDAAQESRERQEQASKVAAWLDESADGQPVVLVANNGTVPVYRVTYVVHGLTSSPLRVARPFLTPTSGVSIDATVTELLRERIRARSGGPKRAALAGIVEPESTGVEIVFTDANGQRWKREHTGALGLVSADYEASRSGAFVGPLADPSHEWWQAQQPSAAIEEAPEAS